MRYDSAPGGIEEADFATVLKKKHNKTGEDSRYQGTLLGKDADQQNITIVGGPIATIQEWGDQLRSRTVSPQLSSSDLSATNTSPLTPVGDNFGDQ